MLRHARQCSLKPVGKHAKISQRHCYRHHFPSLASSLTDAGQWPFIFDIITSFDNITALIISAYRIRSPGQPIRYSTLYRNFPRAPDDDRMQNNDGEDFGHFSSVIALLRARRAVKRARPQHFQEVPGDMPFHYLKQA